MPAEPALKLAEKAEARDKDERAGNAVRELRRKSADAKSDRAELFFDADADLLPSVRQLYRQVDKTQEWAENNYYHLTIDKQTADLVTVNAFWRDYAASLPHAHPEHPLIRAARGVSKTGVST